MARAALPILPTRAFLVATAALLVGCGLIAGIDEFSRPRAAGPLGDAATDGPNDAGGTITLDDGRVVPECVGPGCPPLVIAQTANNPRDIAICSGRVYWADWGTPDASNGAYRSCELGKVCGATGGDTYASNLNGGMLVWGGCIDFYFGAALDAKLYRMARDDAGMLAQTLMADDSAQGGPITSAALFGGDLLWAAPVDQLRHCQTKNCDPAKGTIAGGRTSLGPIRAANEIKDPTHKENESRAIWADGTNGGRVLECRISYCGPTTTSATPDNQGVVVDIVVPSTEDTIYYLTDVGGLYSVVRGASAMVTPLATGLDRPTHFAFDEKNREFFVTSNAGGTIVRVPLGGASPSTMYTGLRGPYGIAYDSDVIYWTDSVAGTVNRARVR